MMNGYAVFKLSMQKYYLFFKGANKRRKNLPLSYKNILEAPTEWVAPRMGVSIELSSLKFGLLNLMELDEVKGRYCPIRGSKAKDNSLPNPFRTGSIVLWLPLLQ
jgi:hypothetical protein